MFKQKSRILLYILIIIGLLCSMVLLSERVEAEDMDRDISCGMLYDDVLLLAGENGQDPLVWLNEVEKGGLTHLIITDQNESAAEMASIYTNLKIGRSGSAAKAGDAFLMPTISGSVPIVSERLEGEKSVPLILLENTTRTGMVMPKGVDLDNLKNPSVKGLYMYDAYNTKYVDGLPYEESENIMYRAVTERGIRFLVISPYFIDGEPVSDPAVYADIVRSLSGRIESRGLRISKDFSLLNAPKLNPALLAGASLLFVGMLVLLLSLCFPKIRRFECISLIFLGLIFVVISYFYPSTMQKTLALCSAILFGCLFGVILAKEAKKSAILPKITSPYLRCIMLTIVLISVGLSGGLYISALLGTSQYMMGVSFFYGVKFSQLAPIIAIFFLLGAALFYKKERPCKRKLFAFGGVLLVILAVLILRSGDALLPVADLELRARNWLEDILYVRPRTKEMLVAFPCLGLFVFSCLKKERLFQVFFGGLAGIGCVSIINTFCHIITPVHLSMIRTLLGAGIGLVIALALLLIIQLFGGKKKVD